MNRRTIVVTLASVAMLGAFVVVHTSCGENKPSESAAGGASPSSPTPAQATPSVPKPTGPPKPVDAATVGTIRGVVKFDGVAPPRKPMSIDGVGGCKVHGPALTEDVIVENGGLLNVVVRLKDGQQGWIAPSAPAEPTKLEQLGCVYRPHVLVTRIGQKLLVANDDANTTHNVNIGSDRNDRLNPTQAPGGLPIEWTPQHAEMGIPFICNLHPWMKAWVCVLDHPWFAVSGAGGSFEIQGVPPGEYVLEAWHEKLGKKTAKVSLSTGGTAEISFTYVAK